MSGLSGRNYEPKHNLARSARSLMSRSSEYSYEPSGPAPWLGSCEISRSPLGPLGSMPTLTLIHTQIHSSRIFYIYIMSDIEDILPGDSVSQLSQPRSFSTSLSSYIAPSDIEPPVLCGIKVIDLCTLVVNTRECLSKLVDHFKKV